MTLVIEACEASYRQTGNPLFVWGAWKGCRARALPIPDWVAESLDKYAEAIVDLIASPPKERVAAAVGQAIGFSQGKNGNNPIAALKKLADSERYMEVFLLARQQGKSETAAIALVAEHLNSDKSTVRRRLIQRCEIFQISLETLNQHVGDPDWASRLALIGQRTPVAFALGGVSECGRPLK